MHLLLNKIQSFIFAVDEDSKDITSSRKYFDRNEVMRTSLLKIDPSAIRLSKRF